MKAILYLLIVIAMLMGGMRAHAFVVESGYTKLTSGEYVRATRVSCEANDKASCWSLCQNETNCQRVEPFCRNCAGTTSPLLRQLFTEISKVYKVKGELKDSTVLLRYLGTELYVLLDIKSIFNYYTPLGSEAFVQELQSFCGADAGNSLLAVTLDSVNQPKELKYVLCRKTNGQTAAYEVEERQPGVGGQKPLTTPLLFQLF